MKYAIIEDADIATVSNSADAWEASLLYKQQQLKVVFGPNK